MDIKSIMAKINSWKDSPAGKAKVGAVLNEHAVSGKPLANGGYVVGDKQMRQMSQALIEMIRVRLPRAISDAGDTLTASEPTRLPSGGHKVILSFDEAALHRDSLRNNRGYSGISNIVALFNNGYRAGNYIYGKWDDHDPIGDAVWDTRNFGVVADYAYIRSKREREALNFMQDAVLEFNALYGEKYGVTVELGIAYTKDND